MKEVLLLKCGEIVLKGLNRKTFEDRLLKNLKRRMAHVADCEITMRQSVVYVEIPDDAAADAGTVSSMVSRNASQNTVNFFCIGFSFKKRASACAPAHFVNLSSIVAYRQRQSPPCR